MTDKNKTVRGAQSDASEQTAGHLLAQSAAPESPAVTTSQSGPPSGRDAAPLSQDIFGAAGLSKPRNSRAAAAAGVAAAAQLVLDGNVGRGRGVAAGGEGVADAVATAVSDAVADIATGSAVFRLTLQAVEFDALRVEPGSSSLRTDAVESLVLAQGAAARTRVDALRRWCALLAGPQLDVSPPPVAAAVPEPSVSGDISSALNRIVGEIANRTAPTLTARADDASVRGRLHALDLAVGPADRVAFFDYGTLIGTIDGVWQDLVDSDLLSCSVALMKSLRGASNGGASMKSGPSPAEPYMRCYVSAGGLRHCVMVTPTDLGEYEPPWDLTQVPPEAQTPEYDELLAEIAARMEEPYSFQVFAAEGDNRAIDFGIFVTYRQSWTPEGIQAGSLVKTMTLAPREERSYTSRTTYKKSTAAVRATSFERSLRKEAQDTARAASEIVNSAKASLGIEHTASAGIDLGPLGSGGTSTRITANADVSSQRTRQNMREAVKRSAQETKESIRTEVTTTESLERSSEESGKIVNSNDELPVTYLFYQLQRRFRISEQVHEMVPVVMVARAVPEPKQISRAWLFANAWILQEVLLSEDFSEPLRYVIADAVVAETRVGALQAHLEQRRSDLKDARTATFRLTDDAEANAAAAQAIQERFSEAQVAYEAAYQAYLDSLATFNTSELGVRRLLVHIKQNILHYMRAIWNKEDRCQRIFELQSVRVPRLAGRLEYKVVSDREAPPVPPLWIPAFKVEARVTPGTVSAVSDTVPLGQVADLEHPIGFRGNFMVFPLRQHNILTKLLALPYIDNRMGAGDPDHLANYTVADLDAYVSFARKILRDDELANLIPRVRCLYDALLDRPFPDAEEIVVPTDSTFIEALPGTRPVLEDYKLLHRVLDVAKVAGEVRARELENLRLVARIRAGELSDPEVQTMIVAPENAGVNVAIAPASPAGDGR